MIPKDGDPIDLEFRLSKKHSGTPEDLAEFVAGCWKVYHDSFVHSVVRLIIKSGDDTGRVAELTPDHEDFPALIREISSIIIKMDSS